MAHLAWHIGGQLILLLAVSAAACGFGLALLAGLCVPCEHILERYLFAQTLGYGCLSMIMLGLGALALYYPIWVWIVLGIGLILFGYFGRRLLPVRLPQLARTSTAEAVVSGALAGVIVLALGYSLWVNALVPPVSYDVVAYHFAIPKLYLAAHRIVYLPTIVYSNWPLGTEMLYALGLLLGSEFLPQLITWAFALMILIGLLCLAHGRLPPTTGFWSAAILFSTPMMASIAGTGLVEIPLAAYAFLAFYAFWRWREVRTVNWLLVAAILGGLAGTTKLNGAAIALVVGGLILATHMWTRQAARAGRDFFVYGVVSLLVALPWYLKTWIFTGNPLWPFLQPLLGGRDWDALGTEYLLNYLHTTNLPATLPNWVLGLWYVTTDAGRFGSFQIGPYLLALLPLAILPAVFNRQLRPLLASLGIAGLALYTIWFLLTQQTRFLLPVCPLMALLAGAGVAWLSQLHVKPVVYAVGLAVMLWLVSGAWVFNPVRRTEWQQRWPYMQGIASRDEFLTSNYSDYPVFHYANTNLAPGACILMVPYDVRGYYLDQGYLWGNILSQRFVRLEQFANATALASGLRDLGVTHVWLNTHYIFSGIRYGDYDMQLISALVAQDGNLIASAGSTQLYELRSVSGTQTRAGACGA